MRYKGLELPPLDVFDTPTVIVLVLSCFVPKKLDLVVCQGFVSLPVIFASITS